LGVTREGYSCSSRTSSCFKESSASGDMEDWSRSWYSARYAAIAVRSFLARSFTCTGTVPGFFILVLYPIEPSGAQWLVVDLEAAFDATRIGCRAGIEAVRIDIRDTG